MFQKIIFRFIFLVILLVASSIGVLAQTINFRNTELKQFSKVRIDSGKSKVVDFSIPVSDLSKWDEPNNKWKLYPGEYTVFVGGDSSQARLSASFKLK
ncbi:MAG TPA: fibronectin type III-like domain-contianing protein [Prolixibacteraceae bacterium]|nr:fibronectin type III-like domain-contianing protein [Prolixibacteraceae bacterium]